MGGIPSRMNRACGEPFPSPDGLSGRNVGNSQGTGGVPDGPAASSLSLLSGTDRSITGILSIETKSKHFSLVSHFFTCMTTGLAHSTTIPWLTAIAGVPGTWTAFVIIDCRHLICSPTSQHLCNSHSLVKTKVEVQRLVSALSLSVD